MTWADLGTSDLSVSRGVQERLDAFWNETAKADRLEARAKSFGQPNILVRLQRGRRCRQKGSRQVGVAWELRKGRVSKWL